MAVVQIFELGSEDVPLSTLHEGEHVFGRGELLKCNDRRVSRKHGVLKVTSSGATITSIHQNPCFYQAANSTTVTILPRDTSVDISDGDKFAVLNDHVWFKLKLSDDDHNKTESTAPSNNTSSHNVEESFINDISPLPYTSLPPPSTTTDSKGGNLEPQHVVQSLNNDMEIIKEEIRDAQAQNQNGKLEDDNLEMIKEEIQDVQAFTPEQNQADMSEDVELPVKKMKYSSDSKEDVFSYKNDIQNNLSKNVASQSNVKNGNNDYLKSILYSSDEDVENEAPQQSVAGKASNNDNKEGNEVNESENVQNKEDLDKNDDGAKAGTSNENGEKDRRDRCWYGDKCYRKNAAHRQEYAHPGDSDYETDPEDNRPTCAYGAACYRRNKEHRQDYKHPKSGTKPASGKRRKRTNNDTAPKKRTVRKTYKESSEDEYDFEDPFLDDSETEYEATSSDESDSDSNSSDDASEENNKRLMKEAKKFVKDRKRAKKE